MQVIAVITIVLLGASLAGVNKSTYARITIGSIFGLLFFTVWPYVLYARDLLHWQDINIEITFALFNIVAAGVSVALVKYTKSEVVGVVAAVIFVTLTVGVWNYDVGIKNIIDNYYLMTTDKVSSVVVKAPAENSKKYEYRSGGYSIEIPGAWVRKDDLGEQHIYFQRIQNNKVVAELRPGCINKEYVSLGEIVINLRSGGRDFSPEIACYSLEGTNKSCTAIYKEQGGEIDRLTQFGYMSGMRKGYDLDFIISADDEDLKNQIEDIVSSIRPLPKQEEPYPCLGLAEWMWKLSSGYFRYFSIAMQSHEVFVSSEAVILNVS